MKVCYNNSTFEIAQVKKLKIDTEMGKDMEKQGYCFDYRCIIEKNQMHLVCLFEQEIRVSSYKLDLQIFKDQKEISFDVETIKDTKILQNDKCLS